MICKQLDSTEEPLGEEMTTDDREALNEAPREHRQGKTIPFAKASKLKRLKELRGIDKAHAKAVREGIRELNEEHRREARE